MRSSASLGPLMISPVWLSTVGSANYTLQKVQFSSVQFSSVQFKMISKCSGKPINALIRSLRSFPNVPVETVSMLASHWQWAPSCPFKVDCQPCLFLCHSPRGDRWGAVPIMCPQVVSQAFWFFRSSKTTNHLWWLLCPPVCLLLTLISWWP